MAKSIYRRLTRRRRALFGYSQLWAAPDHLLLVQSSRFVENYQRFAFADVQAIVVTERRDRLVAQISIALAAILWSAAALAMQGWFGRGFFLITGALAVAAVAVDILRGPRCRCHLYTAVSRELLAPVDRVRTAKRFLAEIRPAVEAAQGRLEQAPAETPFTPAGAPPEIPAAHGYLPELVFVLFLIDAALLLASLRFPRSPVAGALPTTFFAEIVLVIVALLRAGRESRRVIYAVIAAALVCIGWDGFHLGRSLIALSLESARRPHPEALMTAWEPLAHGEAIFAVAWRIAAGTVGLVMAYLSRIA